MAGNKIGGQKAALKIRERYGEDYYAVIGKTGGKNGTGHTFAHGKVDPSVAGKKGGHISKRGVTA